MSKPVVLATIFGVLNFFTLFFAIASSSDSPNAELFRLIARIIGVVTFFVVILIVREMKKREPKH